MDEFLKFLAMQGIGVPRTFDVHAGLVPGMKAAGNIDLHKRPIVKNKDGSISTVRSISVGMDDGEYLIPTVSPTGKILSDQEAIDLFLRSGQHLGLFSNPDAATAYAKSLHDRQAKEYLPKAKGLFQ